MYFKNNVYKVKPEVNMSFYHFLNPKLENKNEPILTSIRQVGTFQTTILENDFKHLLLSDA